MLLLFLARSGNCDELFKEFQGIVKAAQKRKEDIADKLPDDDPRKAFIIMTVEFDQRRVVMLEALKNRDMQQFQHRMVLFQIFVQDIKTLFLFY